MSNMENKDLGSSRTDNELIAEFMGLRFRKACGVFTDRQYIEVYSKEDRQWMDASKYETSWDWLMPVVEKIESLSQDYRTVLSFGNGFNSFAITRRMKSKPFAMYESPLGISTKIEVVYIAVVQFIKWYNSKKS